MGFGYSCRDELAGGLFIAGGERVKGSVYDCRDEPAGGQIYNHNEPLQTAIKKKKINK